MRITKLRIENFRSMHSLELELGGTTVLIGPNNAGKSAILEAVRILLTPPPGATWDRIHRERRTPSRRQHRPARRPTHQDYASFGRGQPGRVASGHSC